MPIDNVKSSAYLRYRKEQSYKSYSKITAETGVPSTTLSAYFNGTVKSPNVDTFESLMSCVGGSWEEYDAWTIPLTDLPPKNTPEGVPDMNVSEIIAHIRQTYSDAAEEQREAYTAALAANDKAARVQRIEKYVLFFLLVAVSIYAIFAFTHYDLPDPSSGITSLLQ